MHLLILRVPSGGADGSIQPGRCLAHSRCFKRISRERGCGLPFGVAACWGSQVSWVQGVWRPSLGVSPGWFHTVFKGLVKGMGKREGVWKRGPKEPGFLLPVSQRPELSRASDQPVQEAQGLADMLNEDFRGLVCCHRGPEAPLGQWRGHPREVSGAGHSWHRNPTAAGRKQVGEVYFRLLHF